MLSQTVAVPVTGKKQWAQSAAICFIVQRACKYGTLAMEGDMLDMPLWSERTKSRM
jgi:hypothetical protein